MKKLNLFTATFCFLLFLVITGVFSCKKSSSDSNISVGGSWSGTVAQNADGSQAAETDNITLSLSQSGNNITGTFNKNGTSPSSGTVSGTISGSNVTITCTSTTSNGGANLKGTVNSSGNSMSGSFTALTGTDAGTWQITKN